MDIRAALREHLADINPASLPEPVRDVLAALTLLDQDPDPQTEPAAGVDATTAATTAAAQRPALAVRASQLRALTTLHEFER